MNPQQKPEAPSLIILRVPRLRKAQYVRAAQARRQTLAAWCCELLDQAAQTNNPKPKP